MVKTMVGIDVGGTFTDVIVSTTSDNADPNRSSHMTIAKTPTTPANQALGVVTGIEAAKLDPSDINLIVHGTTITTNAILERKIARCGLVTTKGFRDVLELGRRTRPQAYGMFGQFQPLVPRDRRLEVTERIDAQGRIRTPLDEAELREQILQLKDADTESLIIHFLHAYANPVHELRALEIAKEIWPNAYISVGHQLISEYREYERGTTASVNAAVQPVLDRYIGNLQGRLRDSGYDRDLLVMNGNGGTVAADIVAVEAAKTVMSGPASGVIAAAATAEPAGFKNIITYDMGGTSTDVALVLDGKPTASSELSIDYGLPIHVPMVDVRTIGAGGGSIGHINAAGLLEVGPESAGADPGPVAYGRGGELATITDANVILGRLQLETFANSRANPVTMEQVRTAMQTHVADPLGLSIEEAAAAMVHIANTQMAGAIRMVSLTRGHDPRDFALFAFGGAGPLHAVALARELAIPRVMIPARPGLVNALGCLVADLRQDLVNTINKPLEDVDMDDVKQLMADQKERGINANMAVADGIERTDISYSADMQFRGQTHLIRIELPDKNVSKDDIQRIFEAAYFERFQVELPEIKAVLVNINTTVVGVRPHVPLEDLLNHENRATALNDAKTDERDVIFADKTHATPIYARDAIPLGAVIAGPAILEQMDSTSLVEPGTHGEIDTMGNLIIHVPVEMSETKNGSAS